MLAAVAPSPVDVPVPLRTGTPLDDWHVGLPLQCVTHIHGPVASGKTTLLHQIAQGFCEGGNSGAWVHFFTGSSQPWTRPSRLSEINSPSLDTLFESVKKVREEDVVLIDDVPGYCGSGSGPASAAKEWHDLLRHLKNIGCTVVLTSQNQRGETTPRSPKAISFSSVLILNLEIVVTTSEGPVVEMTAIKSKFTDLGTVSPLRLWVRPCHKFPISKT